MSQYPDFAFEINQNEFLAAGAREVHAVVTLTATAVDAASAPAPASYGAPSGTENVEVIIIDCSGSMDYPRTKMMAAKEATKVAIDTLSDGAYFAVVRRMSWRRIRSGSQEFSCWRCQPGYGIQDRTVSPRS